MRFLQYRHWRMVRPGTVSPDTERDLPNAVVCVMRDTVAAVLRPHGHGRVWAGGDACTVTPCVTGGRQAR